MPIEVRQLLIKSTVGEAEDRGRAEEVSSETLERLREEILAECKAWFEDRLQQMRER